LAAKSTVLIAVSDGVLADSLRFSLELEGYAAKLCSLPLDDGEAIERQTCLLLDQDVFAAMLRKNTVKAIRRLPTVLMVNQRTRLLLEQARNAGIASVVEKPLVGGILLDAIRLALETEVALGKD
jgi:hypothetical protein